MGKIWPSICTFANNSEPETAGPFFPCLGPKPTNLPRFTLSLSPSKILLGSDQARTSIVGTSKILLPSSFKISNIAHAAGVQAE